MVKFITTQQGDELRKLYAEQAALQPLIADALRTNGKPLEGELLAKLMAIHDKESEIMRKIKEILGA